VSERRRRLHFRDDFEKLAFIQEGAARDAQKTPVVQLATTLVRPFAPDDYARRVQEIHRFVRDGIHYQHDPNLRQRLTDAETALNWGMENCTGKTRTAVALARSLGIDAKHWGVWRGPVLVHVQPAYRWPGSEMFPGAKSDTDPRAGRQLAPTGKAEWVIGEVTVKGAELGADPLQIPKNPSTGRLPLSLEPSSEKLHRELRACPREPTDRLALVDDVIRRDVGEEVLGELVDFSERFQEHAPLVRVQAGERLAGALEGHLRGAHHAVAHLAFWPRRRRFDDARRQLSRAHDVASHEQRSPTSSPAHFRQFSDHSRSGALSMMCSHTSLS